jgi:hypothetical protein
MKKFMVLYMASAADFEKMMKSSTPEQQKKGMDAWIKWMGKHKKSVVEGGGPLGKTKRVDAKGASNTKNGIGGFSTCKRNLMTRPRRCSARTIPTCRSMQWTRVSLHNVVLNATIWVEPYRLSLRSFGRLASQRCWTSLT